MRRILRSDDGRAAESESENEANQGERATTGAGKHTLTLDAGSENRQHSGLPGGCGL